MIPALLQLPLYLSDPPVVSTATSNAQGTPVWGLAQWIAENFQLTSDILGVVPIDEPYTPVLPLLWINTLAFQASSSSTLQLLIVVRLNSTTAVPNPLHIEDNSVVPYESMDAAQAGVRMVQTLQQFGFLRLTLNDEETNLIRQGYATIGAWLAHQDLKNAWRENITKHEEQARFVGFSTDAHRQWLQLRYPLEASKWPPKALEKEFAQLCLNVFGCMDRKVYFCLKLIADTLALNLESVLDDYYFGHSTESQTLDNFGASVLRVYSYDPQTEPQQPTGCGIHASPFGGKRFNC